MIRNIFLLMLSALCAWSCTDNLPGDEAPTDDRHSLNITVGFAIFLTINLDSQ